MRILIAIGTAVAQALYGALKLLPARHKVVMLSRQSNSASRDFAMLADELRARDGDLEVVVRCRFVGDTVASRIGYFGEFFVQLYHLATAGVCVADGHVLPVSALRHRPSLTVVQMWHALGAIKKFGYQALDLPGGRSSAMAEALKMHRNYDHVLCGGEGTIPVFAEAFGVDLRVVRPLGLPRVDYLRARAAEEAGAERSTTSVALERRFPILGDPSRTRILYVPTFRKGGAARFDEVVRRFGTAGYALMIKPHELDRALIPTGSGAIDVSGTSVLDLIPLADAVITDYSAVAFEARVADVPLYFYVYDIDEYRDRQGLNLDPLTELAGSASREIDEIGAWIDSGVYDFDTMRDFWARYLPAPHENCTSRIADLVFDHLGKSTAA